jgi:hypothetical protein
VGQTSQRYSGLFFLDSALIPEISPLPKVIGAATINTSPINVAGFNTFMVILETTVQSVTFSVNVIDPRDQTTILNNTATSLIAPGGLTVISFGFGSLAANAGQHVFYFMSLRFVGALAGATINQFPGLWGCVR